ncbi:IS110 family transposase [Amycolatopsis stemonae]
MGRYWAGIDWSEQLNDVAVVDTAGQVVTRARIPETPAGVKELLRLLSGLSTSHRHSRRQVPVAIETSSSLLVEALRAARQPVHVIHPSMAARYRARLSPAKAKSDKGDAVMLANILRVDGPLHRALPASSDLARSITVLARAQLRARWSMQFHANRLRGILRDVHPAALTAWADLPDGFRRAEARAVLAAGPTPRTAARLDAVELCHILDGAGRTRLRMNRALHLQAAFAEPVILRPPAVEAAMGAEVLAYLGQLDQACATASELADQVEAAFDSHPHAEIYRSFPGCGSLIGARLLGEIGDDPARFATGRGLRAYAGAAPLTWASGGSSSVTHRRIANRWLKNVGHVWAFAALTRSPGCRAHYDQRRQVGDRHAAALRHLFGRLLVCLHHCLQAGELYQEGIAFPAPPVTS